MSDPKSNSNKDHGRVLLSCTAELYVNALLASRGMLTITERRLCFTPGNLELLRAKELHLDISMDDIETVRITGMRRRLAIKTSAKDTIIFGGTTVRRAFMILITLLEDLDGTLDSQDLMLPSWDAYFYQGPLASPGEISINARNFRFIPSSALDALAGTVDTMTINMADIVEARVKGLLAKRLVITTPKAEHIFSMTDLVQRCEDLTHQLVHAYGSAEPKPTIDGRITDMSWAKAQVEAWRPGESEEEILLFGAVVYVSQRQVIRRGWLCLMDSVALFLPVQKLDDGPKPLILPTIRMTRPQDIDEESGELIVKIAGTNLRFLPRGGDAFSHEFWRQWSIIPEIRARIDEENKPPRPLTGEDDINRRESFRVRVDHIEGFGFEAIVLPSSSSQSARRINAHPLDLSVGGLCFSCDERLPQNTELEVKLKMKSQKLSCLGIVIHSEQIPAEPRWKIGVALPELLIFDETSLRSIVMKCQQIELVARQPKPEETDS
jgi:hypothetical protein